jgi:hypothetical protein
LLDIFSVESLSFPFIASGCTMVMRNPHNMGVVVLALCTVCSSSSTDKDSVGSTKQQESVSAVKTQANVHGTGSAATDICAATFLDVAVLRCLFIAQWQEEGVYWALQFYYHR